MQQSPKHTQIPWNLFANRRGFSLVETLVAITVLLIAVLAPMRITSQAIKSAAFSREQLTAVFLAQEGIESMINLRDDVALEYIGGSESNSWAWYDNLDSECKDLDTGCSYDVTQTDASGIIDCNPETNCRVYLDEDASGGLYYTHDSGDGTATPYTRVVTVTEAESDREAIITSTVSWSSSALNQPISISTRTRVFNQYE